MKNKKIISNIIIYSFAFFFLFPIIILCLWSFAKNWSWPLVIPKEFGLRGLKYALDTKSKNLSILFKSIGISTIVTFITIIISIPAAKALGIYNFKGKNFIKILIFSPIIVPGISVALGTHVSFLKLGLANTILGVIIIHLIPCIPYAVFMLTDVFEIIRDKMEKQAKVLGANRYQCFFYVTLPLISSGIMSAAFMTFIISFSQYFLTFLIGGGQVITYPIVMFPFIQSGDKTIASSFSLIFIITSLIYLLIINKCIKSYYKTDKFLNV
ncbi:ABC transporter permease subunit [Clostridium botulinum]|nr:ABC transporter permease subunit [Clostridium botulinum]NFI78476.1 ABC transporter permease subunit [Clostridium botulinum]NFJ37347.1 ABC transporter permease subunit [Clostridium botulinum]